jgi:hypothetical protein
MKGLEHYLILITLRINKYLLHNNNVDENMIDHCEIFIHLGMDVGI